MKLSVSLSDDDVAVLDRYAAQVGLPSRSAAIARAIRRLPDPHLEAAYADAWDEWSADTATWDSTVADGLDDAAR